MNHAPIVPVVLPALTAALMLLDRRLASQRLLAWVSTLLLAGSAAWMLALAADGWRGVYLLGNWSAPWGIALVADRLSALMVALSAGLGLMALAGAHGGWDERGEHFHPLLQIQLMGLNGAFLTGDLFNLFVFFEVLLIASYGLLVHGDGPARMAAGLRFVTLNLFGSALFLVAASLLYGVTGTLNMADLALRVPQLTGARSTLAHAGAWMLLTVFCLKAAILPLGFWLPATYPSASPPVAALFAIMTKVGVYAVLRVFTLVFGAQAETFAPFPWIAALGALAYLVAMFAALGAGSLRGLAALLVVGSAAFLMVGVGLANTESIAAAVFYLPHTTLSAAALLLVAGRVAHTRGDAADGLRAGPATDRPVLVGGLFALSAIGIAGLPPFTGFIAKAMLLNAMLPTAANATGLPIAWLWAALLVGSLLATIALARAGSTLFWSARTADQGHQPRPDHPAWRGQTAAACMALAAMMMLVVGAAPLQRFALATAKDLLAPASLIEQVLKTPPLPSPHTKPAESIR